MKWKLPSRIEICPKKISNVVEQSRESRKEAKKLLQKAKEKVGKSDRKSFRNL